MGEFGSVVVIYDIIPEVAAQMQRTLGKIVRKAAYDCQAAAQATVVVDTGFLKNSIYTISKGYSTYQSASGKAGRKNSDAEMLPEEPHPTSSTEASCAVGANYGVFVEFGTSRMSAQPYLTPAVAKVQPEFLHALSDLLTKMETEGEIPAVGDAPGATEA